MTTTTRQPAVIQELDETQSGVSSDVLMRAGESLCIYIGQHPDAPVIRTRAPFVAQRVEAYIDAAIRIDEFVAAAKHLSEDDRNAIALVLAVPLGRS